MLVQDLINKGFNVEFDNTSALTRKIKFTKNGFYSFLKKGYYRYGKYATFSRIYIKK